MELTNIRHVGGGIDSDVVRLEPWVLDNLYWCYLSREHHDSKPRRSNVTRWLWAQTAATWFGRTVGWLLAYQARPNGRRLWPGAFHPARLGRFGGAADDPAKRV